MLVSKKKWLALAAVAGLCLAIVVLLFIVFLSPPQLQLAAQVKTEYVELELQERQEFHLSDAVICIPQTKRSLVEQRGCVGRWQHFRTTSKDSEEILVLTASKNQSITLHLSSESDGQFMMELNTQAESLGTLWALDTNENYVLPSQAIMYWSPLINNDNTVLLPFIGTANIGRSVALGVDKILDSGTISIFSASEESLTGRALIEKLDLALGDQVLLGHEETYSEEPAMRGFVLFNTAKPFADSSKLMDVVVYGSAKQLRILRYGEQGYGFKPGWWAKIKYRSNLVIIVILLTGLLSILGSVCDLYDRMARFLAKGKA